MTNAEKDCRQLWAKIVKHRDRCCIICGSPGNEIFPLEAHHLFNVSQGNWPTLFDIDYGVTLCKDHHEPTPKDSELFEKIVARIRVKDEERADKILTRANTPITPCVLTFDARLVKRILKQQWETIEDSWMDDGIECGYGDGI